MYEGPGHWSGCELWTDLTLSFMQLRSTVPVVNTDKQAGVER